ncbi:MAG: 2-oxoacid:ferredoxin oxidoreductase subunit beta [Alphaproteobacteria bacterium]|nr:2-oxoacid:ferredoxin oxidoreductase subunit beta [Alphaproteobacteria bacterium]
MTKTYTPAEPIWCAGCGDFGVQGALERSLIDLNIAKHDVMILAGIGCSGTLQNNVGTYGYHALHGRVLPAATGVAFANPDLTVIAVGGDGDGFAIGAGHFVHSVKRNPNLVYIVMNNSVYGLTKGQDSPTMDSSAAEGLDSTRLALSIPGASFIARGFSRWSAQLHELTVAALEHTRAGRGFAFLEVLSPCVTYNDTYASWESMLDNLDEDPDYDPTDLSMAFSRGVALDAEGRMPAGVIYRNDGAVGKEAPPSMAGQDLNPAQHLDAYRGIMNSYAV